MNHLSLIMAVLFFCSSVCTMLNAEDDFDHSPLDPTIPIHPIGFYNGSPGAWFMYGELLCISVNNGIEFWEKVDETHSRVVSMIENTGLIRAFTRKEHVIYGLDIEGRVYVISAADPEMPRLTSRLEGIRTQNFGEWTLTQFFISDQYLIVCDRNKFAQQFESVPLTVYDISDPEDPKVPDIIQWNESSYPMGVMSPFFEVFMDNERIYETVDENAPLGNRIKLVKESRSGEKQILLVNKENHFSLQFEEGVCKVQSDDGQEMVLFDEKRPSTSEVVGFVYGDEDNVYGEEFITLFYVDPERIIRFALTTDRSDESVWKKDLPVTSPAPCLVNINQLSVSNNLLFALSDKNEKLYQIDMTHVSKPRMVSQITAIEASVNGDFIWVDCGATVETYRINGEAPLVQIGQLPKPPGTITGSISSDGNTICLLGEDKVSLYHAASESNPQPFHQIEKSWTDFVHYQHFLIGKAAGGFEMLDISDPNHPVELGILESQSTGDLMLSGSVLVVLPPSDEYGTELELFDLSSLPNVRRVVDSDGSNENELERMISICASPNFIYKGSYFSFSDGVLTGINRIPILHSETLVVSVPILEGSFGPYDTHSYYFPSSMAVVNGHLCIGTDDKGIALISLKEPQ